MSALKYSTPSYQYLVDTLAAVTVGLDVYLLQGAELLLNKSYFYDTERECLPALSGHLSGVKGQLLQGFMEQGAVSGE